MGFLSRWRFASAVAEETFADDNIPQVVFGDGWGYSTTLGITAEPRISRTEAISVPAVKRARDLIAGTLGGLPIRYLDGAFDVRANPLLDQPERARPRSVTMTETFDDLLFEARSFWRITQFTDGYPSQVVKLDVNSVAWDEDRKVWYRRDGRAQGSSRVEYEDAELIRFYSPNDALLVAGARAIRTCLKLDAAAGRYADEPMPTGYFEPREGADPVDDDDVTGILDAWGKSRRTRSTAYVPAALQYSVVQQSAVDIQLSDQRQNAVLDIARAAGIDPEDLGVSTTSRTYQNRADRNQALIDFTLSAYISAVQDRLSMPDVTPEGYTARFDFAGFVKSDEKTRYETYAIARTLNVIDAQDIQRREELPAKAITPTPAPVQEAPVQQSAEPGQSFDDDEDALQFGFETEDTLSFSVDRAKREIVGLAVPYNVTTTKGGRKFQFSQGKFTPRDPSRVKARMDHDRLQSVGVATTLDDSPEGLWAKIKIARGPEGDRALSLAEDGVYDGLSVGVAADARWEDRDGVRHLISGRLVEISLTPYPAFDDARVSSVAASADDEGNTMTGTAEQTGTPAAPVQFDASEITKAISEGFAALGKGPADTGRAVIPAHGEGETFDVNEENPYRFDADSEQFQPGAAFDFMTDLKASHNDAGANGRVLEFLGEQFAVTAANTAALNPNRQRPDMYVDRREYQYPLWAAVRKDTLPDATPLVLPKYNTSSGLIASMSEGVEPSAGAFTTTDQTITPTEVGGKVEITRRLWDQIGPRVSTEIFRKMTSGWYEMLEANVVAALDAVTPVGITLTTAAANKALSGEIAGAFSDLQYIRGGFAFDTFAAQTDLYKKLATAVSDTGEPLFPMISPNNRNGSAASKFARMNVHGAEVFPEWALAATSASATSSYLFDKSSVYAAASVPQRLDWNFGATVQSSTNVPQVSMVTIGIHGYAATAILDLAGVREVIYDPI